VLFKRTSRRLAPADRNTQAPPQDARFWQNGAHPAVGAKAEIPVISRPTMSDCTESVPS
jgi:hypothetical protein